MAGFEVSTEAGNGGHVVRRRSMPLRTGLGAMGTDPQKDTGRPPLVCSPILARFDLGGIVQPEPRRPGCVLSLHARLLPDVCQAVPGPDRRARQRDPWNVHGAVSGLLLDSALGRVRVVGPYHCQRMATSFRG